jgi:hypothetical protein
MERIATVAAIKIKKPNETLREKAAPKNPMMGGPNKKPKKPIVDTAANAMLDFILSF